MHQTSKPDPVSRVQRRLTAILSADIAGYSRLMGADEEGTLARLRAVRQELVNPKLVQHHGRLVKTTGDGVLVEFASVVDALRCAVEVQRSMAQRNAEVSPDKRIEARMGINVCDIIFAGTDLFGEGVNVAARLERMAEPGGICVSGRAKEDAEGKLNIGFTDLGEHTLKNIAKPIRVFRVDMEAHPSHPAPALPEKPSLAVLPFPNMSGDPAQEYFADGVAEEIIMALSRVRSLFVIARNTSFTYKGKAVDAKQIGHDLGVRYLLAGSVRKAGERVRITAQLIDAASGSHIWSDRYDGGVEDIFDLQDRITENIVGAIQPSLLLAEIERTRRKRPESLDAYECMLRAYPFIWAFDPVANTTALDHLQRAIEIEPEYSPALALAAWCQARKVIYNWTPALDEAKAEGLRLAKLAGDASNGDPMVLTALGAAHSVIGDLERAAALIEKAVALDPNSAMAWNRSGWVNAFLDRPEIAIEHFERAIRRSPFDPMNFNCYFGIRNAHFAAGRYEESLAWCRKGMLERPELLWPLRSMAACLALLGRIEEAREAVRLLREGHPDITIAQIIAITPHRGDYVRRYAEGLRLAGLPE
ncbi:MAG: adenylate/guanylate cyclase domain-containing protein [Hyphomicrobiales bacterium]|nr:adenylate/guanylate cyclase domain-containing protein [Hyphomicrobiales bacterium]